MRLNWKNLCVLALLLIAVLTTASCASTQSAANYSSASQEVSRQIDPDLNKLIGTWECNVKHTSAKWTGGPYGSLVIYEDNNKLFALYGTRNTKRRKVEIMSDGSTLMISFRSSFVTTVRLTLMKDNWLEGAITLANDQRSQYAMTCLKQN